MKKTAKCCATCAHRDDESVGGAGRCIECMDSGCASKWKAAKAAKATGRWLAVLAVVLAVCAGCGSITWPPWTPTPTPTPTNAPPVDPPVPPTPPVPTPTPTVAKFSALNFLMFGQVNNNAYASTLCLLGDKIAPAYRDALVQYCREQGCNALFFYVGNLSPTADAGTINPWAGSLPSSAFNEAKLAQWRALLEVWSRDFELCPILADGDDKSVCIQPEVSWRPYVERMARLFSGLRVKYVVTCLEANKAWGSGNNQFVCYHIRHYWSPTQPTAVHTDVSSGPALANAEGCDALFSMAPWQPWTFGTATPEQAYDWGRGYLAQVGRPVNFCEYATQAGQPSAKLGLAFAFTGPGCMGIGGGFPKGLPAFMEALPAGWTSSRSGSIVTVQSAGRAIAQADLAAGTFKRL